MVASSNEGETPFETYILSLLSCFEKDPSLAFEPHSTSEAKTPEQKQIERAIFTLGKRAAGQPTPQLPGSRAVATAVCPTCSRPPSTSPFGMELTRPANGNWNGSSFSDMSAEKELELLKAQVQDIARVCKVSSNISHD